jgi:hypothetical protein
METIIQKRPVWLKIIRWTARIIAVLFAIILFFSFTVEDMNPLSINPQDYFFLSLWVLIPIGYLIGLWKEGLGGLISVVSILTLIIILLTREGHYYSFYFYLTLSIFLIPSILYLIYWYFNKTIKAKANSTPN